MEILKKAAVPILLALLTFFNYGCTAGQRKELLDEAMGAGKEYLVSQLPKIGELVTNKILPLVEAKLKEAEQKKLAELDIELSQFAQKDSITGVENKATWKIFDKDNSGSLEPAELASVTQFVAVELAKRVAKGEIDASTAGQTGKSVGLSIAALLGLSVLGKGSKMAASKLAKTTGGGVPIPPGPSV